MSTLKIAPRQRRQLPQQVRIVANDAGGDAVHAVDLRRAVGAAEQNFIAQRVPHHALDAALQRAGRDRRDVIDESLRGHFDQLRRHVAADGNQVAAVDRERRAENPIVVGGLKQHLLACFGIDRRAPTCRFRQRRRACHRATRRRRIPNRA